MNGKKNLVAIFAAVAALFSVAPKLRSAQIEEPLKPALELHESGKIKEALVEYDKVIKAHPKLAEAYFNRGNAYFDLGQDKQAINDYSQALRLNPKDAEAYYNRANAYRRLKQDGPALNDYSAAIKLNPEDARSLTMQLRTDVDDAILQKFFDYLRTLRGHGAGP